MGGSINVGTWYTLKFVVDETDFKVYLDDVLKVDRDWSPPEEYLKTASLHTSYGSAGSGDFDWVKFGTEIGTKTMTLTSGSSSTTTFTWNTSGVAKGNYTISAYAESVPEEANTTDNTYINGVVKVTIPGDINGDFYVDISDATQIGLYWLQLSPPAPTNVDINGDDVIDIGDATLVGLNWLKDP